MPELPEVHTIVTDLKRFIPGLKIKDVWTDILAFKKIKKDVVGEKIISVERRGKNILVKITRNKTILIHQKMTGHLMYGKWVKEGGVWISALPGPMRDDPGNRFIHLIFFLSDGKHLALCDMRKFASAKVLSEKMLKDKLEKLGPEPFDKNFNLKKFSESLKRKGGKIKSVLMDQSLLVGIGNIYSDEILWEAGVHPLKISSKLKNDDIKKIYSAIKPVLNKAIKARGSSYIDYRDAQGEKGKYQEMKNVYDLKGAKCKRRGCNGIIQKIKVGGRSAHFCPKHQKI